MRRIENVAALLVHGARLSDRLLLIERCIAEAPAQARCAVMLTSPSFAGSGASSMLGSPSFAGSGASSLAAGRPNVVVRAAGGGCPCCVGRVSFQVAVTRLLREAQPDRLIVELARQEHVRQAIAVLAGEPLSAVLRVAGVLEAELLSSENPTTSGSSSSSHRTPHGV